MPSGEVVVFAANFLLEPADFLGKEFDRTATAGADHVVMAAAVVLVLVARDAVVEGDFAGQATLGQQLQCAVNGGVADPGVFFLDEAVKFIGGKMVAGFEESAENGVALRRLLQADTLEMAVKDLLGFANHLAGDGGLIIDAILQHGGELGQGTWSGQHFLDDVPKNIIGILKMKFVTALSLLPQNGRVSFSLYSRIP